MKKKLNLDRDNCWKGYVNSLSLLYQTPQQKFESAHEATFKNNAAKKIKFLLIQSTELTERNFTLDGNYAYILDPRTNQLLLAIPSQHIIFEEIRNTNAEGRIRDIILNDSRHIREATWEEMDAILEAFHGENPENIESLNFDPMVSYRGNGQFRSADHAPNPYKIKRDIFNGFSNQLKIEKKFREAYHMENITKLFTY